MTSLGFILPIDRFEIDCFSMFNCPVAKIVLRVQFCFCFNSVWLRSLDILSDLFIDKQRLRCAWKLPCKHVSLSWVFFLFLKKNLPFFVSGTKETEKETCDLECRGGLQLANFTGSWIVLWIISSKCHWWCRAVQHDWWSTGIRPWDRWGTC